ncbi:MAG: prepilin-type N-terminal cleavage/methylation domain-containing protein [Sedimentisphaerales bacterium]|nr:prepilin-type N-terminal cleavage/methylation domain-containing protein [Sedimentisphaerales bacterium]
MQRSPDIKGFTLVELLVALVVSSVILSAVTALAFAMSTAGNVGEDRALGQAQVRQTTLRLLDLIRNAKLICAAPGNDLVLWRADDNGSNTIDVNEVVYLERGTNRRMLRLCHFDTHGSHVVTLSGLADSDTKSSLMSAYDEQFTLLIPGCDEVSFACHGGAIGDPVSRTKSVTVSLDLIENNGVHRYEIDAALRAWAGHLLNADGTALVSDDD